MLGIKRLDRTEKIIFWWFLITFLLDLLSTAFFVLKGFGHLEINAFIYKCGWGIGLPITLAFNLLLFYWIIRSLQRTRDKPGGRFGWVHAVTIFCLFRTLVVINNFITPLVTDVSEAVKPTESELNLVWKVILILLLVIYFVSIISFWVYRRNHVITYGVNKKNEEKNK
jgi:hypothetical protein